MSNSSRATRCRCHLKMRRLTQSRLHSDCEILQALKVVLRVTQDLEAERLGGSFGVFKTIKCASSTTFRFVLPEDTAAVGWRRKWITRGLQLFACLCIS